MTNMHPLKYFVERVVEKHVKMFVGIVWEKMRKDDFEAWGIEKCGKSEGCTHFLHGVLQGIYTIVLDGFNSVTSRDLHSFHIAYYYYY